MLKSDHRRRPSSALRRSVVSAVIINVTCHWCLLLSLVIPIGSRQVLNLVYQNKRDEVSRWPRLINNTVESELRLGDTERLCVSAFAGLRDLRRWICHQKRDEYICLWSRDETQKRPVCIIRKADRAPRTKPISHVRSRVYSKKGQKAKKIW